MLHAQLSGNDLHAPVNQTVENDTGSTIGALIAVTYNGIGTNYPSIVPANGAVDRVRGITQTAMLATAGNNTGFITSLGFLIGNSTTPVDTSPWSEGTTLYAGVTGVLQTTPNGVVIATVYKQDSEYGVLYVENSYVSGGGSGDVVGPSSSTNQALAVWNGTTGTVLQDGPGTNVQPSGALTTQGFITNQIVSGIVTVGANQVWLAPGGLVVEDTIDLSGGGTLVVLD